MVEGSRRVSAQTGHMSVWDMLWHTEQYLIPLRIFIIASPKATDVATSSRKRWRARRNAVLRPIRADVIFLILRFQEAMIQILVS